jgi:hypothetical protein
MKLQTGGRPHIGQPIAGITTMRKFFQVLWFFAPILVIMAFAMAALFILVQFRTGQLGFR